MIVMPPEERERRIQEDKKIMAALSESSSSDLLDSVYREKLSVEQLDDVMCLADELSEWIENKGQNGYLAFCYVGACFQDNMKTESNKV